MTLTMGTNYYVRVPPLPELSHKQSCHKVHIGKDSYGWEFAFRAYGLNDADFYPRIEIKSFAQWKEFLINNVAALAEVSKILSEKPIEDEYSNLWTLSEFFAKVYDSRDYLRRTSDLTSPVYVPSQNFTKWYFSSYDADDDNRQNYYVDSHGWPFDLTEFS